MATVEERIVVLEVKIDHIIRQIDNLVQTRETRDNVVNQLTARVAVLEEREKTSTQLTIALATGLPILMMALAVLFGIKI